ncbi:hypothetical protein C8F01DRAFT_1211146 [Mycena amicta]|nr:hypothetical protein C8F01DRAFT_1211146 [Mycena amicta]
MSDLHSLRTGLQSIHHASIDFRPLSAQPPILDSSTDANSDSDEALPGLKHLKDSVRIDLDVLERFLENPDYESLPPLSTNAAYLIAVWNEVIRAPPPLAAVLKSYPQDNSANTQSASNLVKVDVVADGGCRWIRVNTELDSYLADSDSEDEETSLPAQAQLDNSVIRMARALLAAANVNCVDTSDGLKPPAITLRLTRLDPDKPGENDLRIAQTISVVRDMGISVELGDRSQEKMSPLPAAKPIEVFPSLNINLDLSVLIAFVSDLTHSPLPASVDEAHARFLVPRTEHETGSTVQARALTNQIMQEMLQEMGKGGMFQELHDRLLPLRGPVQLWTTSEARERFLRIVSKIGGPSEKRRAAVLFASEDISQADAEDRFWEGSRFPRRFIPCLPILVYPESEISPASTRPPFFFAMEKTCLEILAQESATPPSKKEDSGGIQQQRANGRLTVHTVRSMLCGARRGWTTLTANRSSVRALVREVRAARPGFPGMPDEGKEVAAIWVVDPRSLAESARERVALQTRILAL